MVIFMLSICSKIVVPYDHSPLSKKALETAIKIANVDHSIQLDLVTVLDIRLPSSYFAAVNAAEAFNVQRVEAREKLYIARKELQTIPNKLSAYLLEGNPADMIVDFVKSHNADLVVMGSRGLSGFQELFLGSVSHQVVQKSPCPVFIIK